LGRSHAELSGFDRVAGRLLELDSVLRALVPARDGGKLGELIRQLMKDLLREDEEAGLTDEELAELLAEQDPDWDVRGLDD
jgi:hypothetical protein